MKQLFLVSLFMFSLVSFAEGTKQIRPTQGDYGYLQIGDQRNGLTVDRNFAMYSADEDTRLNIAISDPVNELITFGIRPETNDPLYFRIKDPNGNIVWGPTLLSTTDGDPGRILDYDEAVAGPSVVDAGGYNALTFQPTMVGNYSIEFNPNDPLVVDREQRVFDLFDITVVNTVSNEAIDGRLWSRAWDINTNASSHAFNGSAYVYTNDGIVTFLEFQDFSPWSFIIQANSHGPQNTGVVEVDRQSIADGVLLPEYRIFLNIPDTTVFPVTEVPEITGVPELDGCSVGGDYCINLSLSNEGIIEYTLDIDGDVGDDHIRDIVGTVRVSPGENCIPWDGRDGEGNLLEAGDTMDIYVSYQTGLTNLLVHDVENNPGGFNIQHVYPEVGINTPMMYYDDTQIGGGSNFDGCLNNCHDWDSNYGNNQTINTWWATFFENDTVFDVVVGQTIDSFTVSLDTLSLPNCVGEGASFEAIYEAGLDADAIWYVNTDSTFRGDVFSPVSVSDEDSITLVLVPNQVCSVGDTLSTIVIVPHYDSLILDVDTIVNPNCVGDGGEYEAIYTSAVGVSLNWYLNGAVESSATNYAPLGLTETDEIKAVLSSSDICTVGDSLSLTPVLGEYDSLFLTLDTLSNPNCVGDGGEYEAIYTSAVGVSLNWYLNGAVESSATNYAPLGLTETDEIKAVLSSSDICIVGDSLSLTPALGEYDSLFLTLDTIVNPNCLGDGGEYEAIYTSAVGVFVNWYLNGTVESSATNYSPMGLVETDDIKAVLSSTNVCTVGDSVSLNPDLGGYDSLTVALDTISEPNCKGEGAQYEAVYISSPGISLNWYLNDISQTSTDNYVPANVNEGDEIELVLSSNDDCTISDTVLLLADLEDELKASFDYDILTTPTCLGDLLEWETTDTVNFGTAYSVHWTLSNGSVKTGVQTLQETVNELLVDVEGIVNTNDVCIENDTVAFSVEVFGSLIPSVSIQASDTSVCVGEFVDFEIQTISDSSSSAVLNWLLNNSITANTDMYQNVSVSNRDSVFLEMEVNEGCTDTVVYSNVIYVEVLNNPLPDVSIAYSGDVCAGDDIEFTINSFTNLGDNPDFEWFHIDSNMNTTSVSTESSFTMVLEESQGIFLQATSSLSCVAPSNQTILSDTIYPSIYAYPELLVSSDTSICMGEDVVISVEDASKLIGSFEWVNTSTQQSVYTGKDLSIEKLQTTASYYAIGNNHNCIDTSAVVSIDVIHVFISLEVNDNVVHVDEQIALDINSSEGEITLYQNQNVLSTEKNSLLLTVTESSEFRAVINNQGCTDEAIVHVSVLEPISAPYMFSPNGDSNNDEWMIGGLEPYSSTQIFIYNRWGTLIREIENSNYWDGRNALGNDLPDGVYYYVIEAHLGEDSADLTGYVTVIH